MERTEFKSLKNVALTLKIADDADEVVLSGYAYCDDILLINSHGEVVACVSPDNFFDQFGNRFSYAS